MADITSGCYECSRECINDQFCGRDGEISLPKILKIKVIANPVFWGFDDGNGNILTQGEAVFSNGHYDFFDGYDELHFAMKDCGAVSTGPYKDENRPDVLYRSVFDPDDLSLVSYGGRRHYGADGSQDNVNRGGAEVYLIDREAITSSDHNSCDTSDPTQVYKTFPENFGFGTKISTTDTVFKNKTGAWRYVSLDNCYDNLFTDSSLVSECDGTAKQNINRGAYFADEYDEFQIRVSGERGCVRDGYIPSAYMGTVNLITRASGIEDFINLELQYGTVAASSLQNGMEIGINGDYLNDSYRVFNVNHSGDSTYCRLVGTLGSGIISETGQHNWIAFNTYDPNTCCGEAAYGISNETKRRNSVKNYHSDFGKIFNNNKNITQSNRFVENRYNYGFGVVTQINPDNSLRVDYSLPTVSSSGTAVINSGSPEFESTYPYYGPFYEIDKYDTSTRTESKYNTTKGNNGTCYSKKATLSVFPDCMTQYNPYRECETNTQKYLTNQVSRLGIVYRGCNYEDNCVFNESGNPYFAPTGIEDLRKGLAGQEVYMYVNLTDAWGAEIKRDPCGCGEDVPPGNEPPVMITVPSPVTFPSFPKFDLYPEDYGCHDPSWQYKFAVECESGTNSCPPPSSDYACSIRQPYTTYGFIRNLCGNQFEDRRSILTNAFSQLIQQGEYLNTSPSGTGPMYWEFNNPYIHESGQSGGVSNSGNYPFWGLSDNVGRLIAPYFRSKPAYAYTRCGSPPSEIPYLDFDLCVTRASGWPTNIVPFLVEVDHDDSCVDCISANMDNDTLNLSIEGLTAEYSHGPNSSRKHGFNHCSYSHEVKVDPVYSCEFGYTPACDNNEYLKYHEPYTGNTCDAMSGDITLKAVYLKGTTKIIGWASDNGVNNSYIKLSGCSEGIDNNFLHPTTPYLSSYGFDIFGSFKLACNGLHNFLYDPDKNLNLLSSNNPLDILYKGGSCGARFPSGDSDLQLSASFALVTSGNEEVFKLLPEGASTSSNSFGNFSSLYARDAVDYLIASRGMGCDVYVTEFGCKTGDNVYYPCAPCPNPFLNVCDCPRIGCDTCGEIETVDGIPSLTPPKEYNVPCNCDCDLQPMRSWLYDSSGSKTLLESFEGIGCSGEVVGVSVSGEIGSIDYIQTYLNGEPIGLGPVAATTSSFCSWKNGVNAKASGINNEFFVPKRLQLGELKCATLNPSECVSGDCEDPLVGLGTCGDPIPWSGEIPEQGVTVNRRSCYPEAMIVNKIECIGDNFKLFVDREYHSHNRSWERIILAGTPPSPICFPIQKGAYRDGETCIAIPFATPTDSVTPAYHVSPVVEDEEIVFYRGVCSTNPSVGAFVTQDFVYGPNPIGSGDDTLWNYYNLYYTDGYPSSKYHQAIYLGDPNADPPEPENPCLDGTIIADYSIFPTGDYETPTGRDGVDWTNKRHSCIQDYASCGGDFFCNKVFFPRQSYKVNTRVSKFGSLQLCKTNSERLLAEWYSGFQDFEDIGYIKAEIQSRKFIDVCDDDIISYIQEDIGVDDTEIIVNDYLPLIGINSSLFRYTIDSKSCMIVGTGCHQLSLHSEFSIEAGVHRNKTFDQDNYSSYGYYLDKVSTLETDNCLFSPFKILVDVECCSSNIRTINGPIEKPTVLEYVAQGVPSWACKGFIKEPSCGCGDSNTCGGTTPLYYPGGPRPICITVQTGPGFGAVGRGDVDYYEGAPCQSMFLSPCPPSSGYIVKEGYIVSDFPPFNDSVYGIYNGTPVSPMPEVIVGANQSMNDYIQGCSCDSGSGVAMWGRPFLNTSLECFGEIAAGSPRLVVAYEFNGFYYIPRQDGFGESFWDCCEFITACSVLGNCWKVPIDECFVFTDSNSGNYLSDLSGIKVCQGAPGFYTCEDSVVKMTITE